MDFSGSSSAFPSSWSSPKAAWNNGVNRFIFFTLSIVGSLLSASSENWLSFWVGMEVSTICFITLVASSPGFVSEVSAWNYYVLQCVGSVLLFLPLILFQGESPSPFILVSGLIGASMKLGLFPFQGWVPHVIENMNLSVLFLLGSVQKVAPLVAMFHLQCEASPFWGMVLLLTAGWVGLTCIGTYSVKQILALSSILMSAWLGFSLLSWSLAVVFLSTYSFHLLILLLSLSDFPFHGKVSALFHPSAGGWQENIIALGITIGLPPFGIFLVKMEVSGHLVNMGFLLPALVMLLCSGLILFAYAKLTVPMVISNESVNVNTILSIALLVGFLFPFWWVFWVGSFYPMKLGIFDPNKEVPQPSVSSSSSSSSL